MATPNAACRHFGAPGPSAACRGSSERAFDILKRNFDATYAGNRAPFPIFVHSPYLSDNLGDVQRFIGGAPVGGASRAARSRPCWQIVAPLCSMAPSSGWIIDQGGIRRFKGGCHAGSLHQRCRLLPSGRPSRSLALGEHAACCPPVPNPLLLPCCRVCCRQAKHVLCDDAPDAGMDDKSGTARPAHQRPPRLRQSWRRPGRSRRRCKASPQAKALP